LSREPLVVPQGSVATSNGPEPVDLSNCEREPIHIPGSIQPHGVLLVADPADLRVVFASANTASLLGMPAASILGGSLQDCLPAGVYGKLVRQDDQGRSIFEPLRSYHFSVDRSHFHFEIRQFNDLVYIEIETEVPEPESESLPAVAQRMVGRMRAATSLPQLLQMAAAELRQLTGYDRVMSYQFAEDGHGIVVAEDADSEMEPYLGLHYPASDIPAQARRLYLLQRIRVIANCDYLPVPLLTFRHDPVPSLDLTFCNLRSISPIHIEYLKNMSVGATLTLSLIVDDDLWGMLVCHHRTPRLPSPAIRSSCDLVSQMTSFLIRARIEQDTLEAAMLARSRVEEIASHLHRQTGICEALAAAHEQLLQLVGAGGALICFEGKAELIGRTPPLQDAMQLLDRLHGKSGGKVFAHNSIPELLPEFASLKTTASGVVLMPILGSQENVILWFRPEIMETIHWGGNPEKPVEIDSATGRVSPRKSFDIWKTQVAGHSLPWTSADTRAANEVRRTISDYLLAKAEGSLSSLGLIDTLTLLPNRRRLQNELRLRAESSEAHHLAVILINLDRFKQVNEAFGHATGDQLLVQVTRRLTQLVTPELLLARLGADEFAVLCSGEMAARADAIAERINNILAAPFELGGKPFRITASLGIAGAAHGERELLRAADTAMHFAKNSGRNKLVAFNKLLHEAAVKSLELQQDMYRALEAHEFKLVYQPIVALDTNTLVGFEALLRWHHPTKGMIPPLDFIPLAEETGLIVPIGRGVLQDAVETTRKWTETFGRRFKIHVNVAAPQLIDAAFVPDIQAILAAASLSPRALSIEVTESILMRDSAVETLTALKALGLEVSIDDFGTGYSSLAYLHKLPVDIVKIDKTFVNEIALDSKSKEFLRALLALTRTLDLTAIAEGVETAAQRDVLVELGCGLAQGYYFSRPLDPIAAEALVARCSQSNWQLLG
jgi:diguanylate cyclase (GGDEF)-like protein